MAKRISRNTKRRGLTLITALAFTLVLGTVLAGVGTVTMSHYGRSKVEGTYANAVALADAGVNYELRRISSDPANTTLAHQWDYPFTSTSDNTIQLPGTFKVHVRTWGSNCDGSTTWFAPNDICVESTGTVNGVSRTIRIRAIRKSIFDEYAIYAVKEGTFVGGGASSGSTRIVGDLGTDGAIKFGGTMGTGTIVGTLDLNGANTSTTPTGSNVVKNPDPVNLPTVDEIANLTFSGGLSWLATHNDNANIKMLSSADTALASEPTVAGLTLDDVNTKLVSAGFTVSSRTFEDPPNTVPNDTNLADDPGSATTPKRFVQPADPSFPSATPFGVRSQKLYLVPPGDYYFNNMDFKSGTAGLVFLTHLGRIRIWVDQPSSGAIKQDNLMVPIIFTDTTASKFRIFYNKCSEMQIGGSTIFRGGFYGVKSGCNDSTPMMNFTGNSMVYGSVMTQYFKVAGGTQVVFPNNGGSSDPTDFSLWFGFKDNWKEVPHESGRTTFTDGTAN